MEDLRKHVDKELSRRAYPDMTYIKVPSKPAIKTMLINLHAAAKNSEGTVRK